MKVHEREEVKGWLNVKYAIKLSLLAKNTAILILEPIGPGNQMYKK